MTAEEVIAGAGVLAPFILAVQRVASQFRPVRLFPPHIFRQARMTSRC